MLLLRRENDIFTPPTARFVPIAALSAKDEDEGHEAGYNGEEGAMKQVRLK